MPRPTKDPSEQRARARQVKFTQAEDETYIRIKDAVARGGPVALDQHFLLWLVVEEGKRHGIAWPSAGATTVRPPTKRALRRSTL